MPGRSNEVERENTRLKRSWLKELNWRTGEPGPAAWGSRRSAAAVPAVGRVRAAWSVGAVRRSDVHAGRSPTPSGYCGRGCGRFRSSIRGGRRKANATRPTRRTCHGWAGCLTRGSPRLRCVGCGNDPSLQQAGRAALRVQGPGPRGVGQAGRAGCYVGPVRRRRAETTTVGVVWESSGRSVADEGPLLLGRRVMCGGGNTAMDVAPECSPTGRCRRPRRVPPDPRPHARPARRVDQAEQEGVRMR
jgi:hypothetical protein